MTSSEQKWYTGRVTECLECATANPEHAKFCLQCGSRLRQSPSEWFTFAEVGPLTFEELHQGLESGLYGLDTLVRKKGEERWAPITDSTGGELTFSCPECSAYIPWRAKFCIECGEDVGESQWFARVTVGPMSIEELRQSLDQNTLVWTVGMAEWAPAEQVPLLSGSGNLNGSETSREVSLVTHIEDYISALRTSYTQISQIYPERDPNAWLAECLRQDPDWSNRDDADCHGITSQLSVAADPPAALGFYLIHLTIPDASSLVRERFAVLMSAARQHIEREDFYQIWRHTNP